jgi:hypothetical protein
MNENLLNKLALYNELKFSTLNLLGHRLLMSSKHYLQAIEALNSRNCNDFLGISNHKDILHTFSYGKSSIEVLEFSDIAIRIKKSKNGLITIVISNCAIYRFKANDFLKPKGFSIGQILGLVVSDTSNQLLIKFQRDFDERSEDALLLDLVKRAEFIESVFKACQNSFSNKEICILLVVGLE